MTAFLGPLTTTWHGPEGRTTPWGKLQWLGVGVLGVTERLPGTLLVQWVEAIYPGQGHVGRWLDRLPTDRAVLFADVQSPKLAAMLTRRGYVAHDGDYLRPADIPSPSSRRPA
jgi:hypothetical protein